MLVKLILSTVAEVKRQHIASVVVIHPPIEDRAFLEDIIKNEGTDDDDPLNVEHL